MNKIIGLIILFFVAEYGAIWLFNHINPWLGIATFFVVIIAYINYIIKQIKKQNQNEKEN